MKRIDFTGNPALLCADHTSRGNQPKWLYNNKWYKQDSFGYEALAEVIASHMLAKSNISDFIQYDPIMITYDVTRVGCVSNNFKEKDDAIIPINRLHRAYRGIGINVATGKIPDVSDRIRYTVEFVEGVTGIKDYGKHLTALLEFDAIILNEDRHFNNIAVIRNEKTGAFRSCPVFDNGLALLSDVLTNPLDSDVYSAIERVQAKPFDRSFLDQVDACERLYQGQLEMHFTKADVRTWLDELSEYYREEYIRRAEDVILEQMRKWIR